MMSLYGSDEQAPAALTYAQKREIERIVRTKMAEYVANMPVINIGVVDGTDELNKLAQEYATEVRDTTANVMRIECQYLLKG